MSNIFRSKHTIAVFETSSKTSTQFTAHALANGHHVVALTNSNKEFAANTTHFKDVDSAEALLEHADVVVIAGGAEHHSAAYHAVKKVAALIAQEKAPKLKHIYLVSASGAKSGAGFFSRALYADLAAAEKILVELAAKHPSVKYTVFRPPHLIETDKSNDVFVYDEAAEKNLVDLSNQVSYNGLADAVLEIVETQPKFVNKVAGINSKTLLVENHDANAETRKATYNAAAKATPFVVAAAAIAAGLIIFVAKRRS
ncbi:NADH(P)-binding-domain-containing protein [Obelidium mucronatum]|nr:NADH(P)-binding-domain-containing protein [Obelidium mucronatum]